MINMNSIHKMALIIVFDDKFELYLVIIESHLLVEQYFDSIEMFRDIF
jgi:hypothetical protein